MRADCEGMTTAELLDHLGEMSRTDPEAFERCSRLLIHRTIESFPPEHRRRAYGLQFRLDAELRHYRDPVARMNRMVEIFWDGVRRFQDALSNPSRHLQEREAAKQSECRVIPLERNKTMH